MKIALIIGGSALGVLALVGLIAWNVLQPSLGEQIAIMPNAGKHFLKGINPGPFYSNPPTSGQHYGQPLESGFYEVGDPETQIPFPDGFILHNLEHGLVIFWYNCDLLDEIACTLLKTQIKKVMDGFNKVKLIGFPWTKLEVPLVMTSWGKTQSFAMFDEEMTKEFVQSNRNYSPEPNAP